MVKYARSNFLVPVPQVRDLDELNGLVVDKCREDQNRRLRGKGAPSSLLHLNNKHQLDRKTARLDKKG